MTFSAATGAASELSGKLRIEAALDPEKLVLWFDAEGAVKAHPQSYTVAQRGRRFVPETIAMVKGSTVKFENLDDVSHNAFSLTPENSFDLGMQLPSGKPMLRSFNREGRFHIFCNIHPEMHMVVNVLSRIAIVRPGPDGSFRLPWKGKRPRELKARVDGPDWRESVMVTFREESGIFLGSLGQKLDTAIPKHRRKDGTSYPEEKEVTY